MVFPAVFTVSLTSLCYEVLLTRFFSYSQWNHLSFMVISIVMFGFAASGSVLSLVERRSPGWSARTLDSPRFTLLLLFCSLAIGGSFLSVKNIPLDYFRMPLEWLQGAYLALTFILLLVPFFCSGAVVSLTFAGMPGQTGWIYFANMLGSAVGALLPASLLPRLGEGRIVLCCALLLLAVPLLRSLLARSWPVFLPAAALFLITGALLLYGGGKHLEIHPSPYKLLPQVLQFPETSVESRSNTIRGRLDRVSSPYIRFAPGLSLKYTGDLPPADFLVQDGDALFVLYDPGDDRAAQFSRYLHSYAGYSLRPLPGGNGKGGNGRGGRVLILQQGGGLSLPCAVSAGAREITLLVEHPEAAAAYRERSSSWEKRSQAKISVASGNLRRHLARDRSLYDRIQVEAWGPSVPGMASLDQQHLLTVEALASCLRRLNPQGVLILSRRLLLPPSDSLKVFAAAFSALDSLGVRSPGTHLILIRGWDSYTLLASPTPFDASDLEDLRDFCLSRNFDPVSYTGIGGQEVNRFNSFAEPFHYREIQRLQAALQENRGEEYFRSYYLDISPARDDRPFHSRFTRWSKLGALFRSTGSRFYTLLLSGETVVLVVLGIAAVLGLVLLLLPRLIPPRTAAAPEPGPGSGGRAAAVLYFLAAGAGFMLVEMAFLQGYTFVFGNPVIAFTVVLAELLVMSGIGGAVSARWSRRALPPVLIVLILCQAALCPLFGAALRLLLAAGAAAQLLGSFILLAPLAFLMGVPFPVALRLLVPTPRFRAFGWAANGVASVVASILAVPLAMSWGISRLLLPAAACYALMLAVLPAFQRLNRRIRNSHLSSPTENQGT
ncbi:MAG: hypothetical protein JXB06_03080 [Spirochaetales bacterium]|nr:hypothetical protein [Spirochaetales bacterium]